MKILCVHFGEIENIPYSSPKVANMPWKGKQLHYLPHFAQFFRLLSSHNQSAGFFLRSIFLS
jgi:hypothetical protein